MSDSYAPSKAMIEEAKRGLSWRREFNRGGTPIGIARARDISNNKNLPIDTVHRMNSFFSRHEVDKQANGFRQGEKGYPSNGRIAWALWGGDAGQTWAKSISDKQKKGGISMNHQNSEDFLSHYGIRGMHWGIRNKKSAKTHKVSADYNRAHTLKARPVSSLTNKQLKTLTERQNLESNYARLNPGKVLAGKQKAELILGTIGVGLAAGRMFKDPVAKSAINTGAKFVGKAAPMNLAVKLSYKAIPKIASVVPKVIP